MLAYPYTSYCDAAGAGSSTAGLIFAARRPGLSPGAASAFSRLMLLRNSDLVGGAAPVTQFGASAAGSACANNAETARNLLSYANKTLPPTEVAEALREHPLVNGRPATELLLRLASIDLRSANDSQSVLESAPVAAFICGFIVSFETFGIMAPADRDDFLALWGLRPARTDSEARAQYGAYRCLQDGCFMELVHCGYHHYVSGVLPEWMTGPADAGAPRDVELADVAAALDLAKIGVPRPSGRAAATIGEAECRLAERLVDTLRKDLEVHRPDKCRREFVEPNLRRVAVRALRAEPEAVSVSSADLVPALVYVLESSCRWRAVDGDDRLRPNNDATQTDEPESEEGDAERPHIKMEEIRAALREMDADGVAEARDDEEE
jgi:hypothetical protein